MNPLQNCFAELLNKYKFKTFATFTTSRPLSLVASRRFAVRFANHINAGDRSTMFWAAEPFDTRDGYHFHGLINSPITNHEMWNYWTNEKQYGRSSFLEIHRKLGNKNQVENYCAKYISKNLADYDLYAAKDIYNLKRLTGKPEITEYVTKYTDL